MKGNAIFRMIIGAVMVVGGLTGKLSLRGTNSGTALAALGGVLLVWGGVQFARASKRG